MQHVQPQINRTVELLQWQYLKTPSGPGHVFALWDGEMLAAVYCAVAQQVQAGTTVVPARMVQDVMTHPHYRGRGFLHQLAKVCLQEIQSEGAVGFTFPNELSQGSFRRTGWAELCKIPLRLKDIGARDLPSAGFLSVQELYGHFSPAASQIWVSSNMGVGLVRDCKYLNWRYQKPGQEYRSYLLNTNKGILVLKLYDSGSKRSVHICELFVDAEFAHLVYDAIRFVETFARSHKAEVLTAWLGPHHPYAPYFLRAEFPLAETLERYMFVTAPESVSTVYKSASSWHVSQGDSDVY